MEPIREEIRNSCGHMARYVITVNGKGVDIESEIHEDCDTCEKEDNEFRKEIQKNLSKYFSD